MSMEAGLLSQQTDGLAPVSPETDDSYVCWICLEAVRKEDVPDRVLRACSCAKYVHRECLDRWRFGTVGPQAQTHCPTCNGKYKIASDTSTAKPACWRTACYAIYIVLAIWLPPMLVFLLLVGLFTPMLYGMDQPRNIPCALRFMNAHIQSLDEVDNYNATGNYSSYFSWLKDRYKSDSSITWDQYALFGGLLAAPLVLMLVNYLIRRLQRSAEDGNRRSAPRSSRNDSCCDNCDCNCNGCDGDLFFWWYIWSNSSGSGRSGSGGYGSSNCCDGCGCDCGDACDCPDSTDCNDCCGCCSDCKGNKDCDCCGGGDGGEAMVAICVIGLIVAIVVLAVAVIASFVYLIFLTVIQTQKLCRAYVRKAIEQHNFRAGHLFVVHLEASNSVTRTPGGAVAQFAGGGAPRKNSDALLLSMTPKADTGITGLKEPPLAQEMW